MKTGANDVREKRPSFVRAIQTGGSKLVKPTVYSDEEMQNLFQRDDFKHVAPLCELRDFLQGPFDVIAYFTRRVHSSYFQTNDDYHELKKAYEFLVDLFGSYKALCANSPSPSDEGYDALIQEIIGFQKEIAQQCRFMSYQFFGEQEFELYTQQDLEAWLQSSKDLTRKLPLVEAQCRKKLRELPEGSSQEEKLTIVAPYKGLKAKHDTLNRRICDKFHLSGEALSSLFGTADESHFQQEVDKTFQVYFSACVSEFHNRVLSRFEKDGADVECLNRALSTLDHHAQTQLSHSPELISSVVSLFEAHHRFKSFVDRICLLEIDSSDADEAVYLQRVQDKFNELKKRLMLNSFSPENVFSKSSEGSVIYSEDVKGALLNFSSASYKLFLDDLFSHVHEYHGAFIDAMNDGSSLDVFYDILNQLVGYDAFIAARDFNKLLIGFFSKLKEVNKVLPGSAALPEDSFVTTIDGLNTSFSPIGSRRTTLASLAHAPDVLDKNRELSFCSPVAQNGDPQGGNELAQCQRFEKPQPFTMNTPGRITLAVGGGVALCSAIAGIALLETINTALPVAQLFAVNPAVPVVIGLLVLSLAAAVVGVGLTCYENGKRGPSLFVDQGVRSQNASSLSFLNESEISPDGDEADKKDVMSPGHE